MTTLRDRLALALLTVLVMAVAVGDETLRDNRCPTAGHQNTNPEVSS